MLDDEETAMLF